MVQRIYASAHLEFWLVGRIARNFILLFSRVRCTPAFSRDTLVQDRSLIDRREIERQHRNVKADLDSAAAAAARITGFNYESRENFDEPGEAAGGD